MSNLAKCVFETHDGRKYTAQFDALQLSASGDMMRDLIVALRPKRLTYHDDYGRLKATLECDESAVIDDAALPSVDDVRGILKPEAKEA